MEQFCQQLVNGLMIGSTYAVVALGFGLVFSVMRVVNLAHPEIFMVGAYVAFVVRTVLNVNAQGLTVLAAVGLFLCVLLAAMVVTGMLGLLLERLVVRPTRGTYLLIPFFSAAGVAVLCHDGTLRRVGPDPLGMLCRLTVH